MKLTAVYHIQNIINGKIYIGGSANVERRFKEHQNRLSKGTHRNKLLMSDYELYGKDAFTYRMVEECTEENLKDVEQKHIDAKDFESLYNLQKDVYGGGADALKNPVLLLDLKGNVVEEFDCGSELASHLGHRILRYDSINTESIFNTEYRAVTPEFYKYNLELIRTWNPYSCKLRYKREQIALKRRCVLIDLRGNEIICADNKETGEVLGITASRVSQLRNEKYKTYKGYTFQENQTSDVNLPEETSEFNGVCFVERSQKWMAYIFIDGKQKYLGLHETEDEAYEARQRAEELIEIGETDMDRLAHNTFTRVLGINELFETAA